MTEIDSNGSSARLTTTQVATMQATRIRMPPTINGRSRSATAWSIGWSDSPTRTTASSRPFSITGRVRTRTQCPTSLCAESRWAWPRSTAARASFDQGRPPGGNPGAADTSRPSASQTSKRRPGDE